MIPARSTIGQAGSPAVSCTIAARGIVHATVEQLKALRQDPGPPIGSALPHSFLKHSDDQSVAGLAAVLRAIHETGQTTEDFTHWGVLAAPRFLARAVVAQAIQRFAAEGAWGVSPHLIPHRSLHSMSGTVSQALKIHGPNLGVGGGPHCTAEAFLAAATMLSAPRLPGVWLILSGWNWEPGVEGPAWRDGDQRSMPWCLSAIALALRHAFTPTSRPSLRIAPTCAPTDAHPPCLYDNADVRCAPLVSFVTLEAFIEAQTKIDEPRHDRWLLSCGGMLEFEIPPTALENCA